MQVCHQKLCVRGTIITQNAKGVMGPQRELPDVTHNVQALATACQVEDIRARFYIGKAT
jgi:hypothetical protein